MLIEKGIFCPYPEVEKKPCFLLSLLGLCHHLFVLLRLLFLRLLSVAGAVFRSQINGVFTLSTFNQRQPPKRC